MEGGLPQGLAGKEPAAAPLSLVADHTALIAAIREQSPNPSVGLAICCNPAPQWPGIATLRAKNGKKASAGRDRLRPPRRLDRPLRLSRPADRGHKGARHSAKRATHKAGHARDRKAAPPKDAKADARNDTLDEIGWRCVDAIRDAFNCAVIIVHHCGHEGTRPRGHSSLMGAIDAQIAVKRDAADNIIATVELMKDGPQGDEFSSRLEVVEIGIDDDGDKITSCVIVPVEGLAPQKEKPKKLPAAAAKALKALHEIIDDAGIIPPHDSYIPPGMRAVTVDQWRDHAFRRGISGSGEMKSKQQAFRRAFDQLAENHRIAVSEPYVWPS
jgi:hypothetical protein